MPWQYIADNLHWVPCSHCQKPHWTLPFCSESFIFWNHNISYHNLSLIVPHTKDQPHCPTRSDIYWSHEYEELLLDFPPLCLLVILERDQPISNWFLDIVSLIYLWWVSTHGVGTHIRLFCRFMMNHSEQYLLPQM